MRTDGSVERSDSATKGLLALALTLCWWLPYLSLPIITFYKEWLFVAALALAALALPPSPSAAAAAAPWWRHPLVLSCGAILVALTLQVVLRDGLWPQAVLTACYVAFFIFALNLGHQLQRHDSARSLLWVAGSLLAAALVACIPAALQLNGILFDWPLVMARSGSRISGNIAQSNHFADLLFLGSVASVCLYARGKVGAVVASLAVLVLACFAQFAGSRMIWVDAALCVAVGVPIGWRARDPVLRRGALALVAVAGLYVVAAVLVSAFGWLELFGLSSGSQRLTSQDGAISNRQRLWLWHSAVDAIRSAPLLGVGVGRFVAHSYALAMQTPDSPTNAADTNAHNIFLHLAAELGVPAALAVALGLAVWLVRAIRRAATSLDALIVVGLCGVILVHGNVEYPLWYTYFLGILGLVAGHLPDTTTPAREPRDVPSNVRAEAWRKAVAIGVLGVAGIAYAQFHHLEQAMKILSMQLSMGAPPQPSAGLDHALSSVPRWSPYRDMAEEIQLIAAVPSPQNAADLAARCDRSIPMGPVPFLLARCAADYQIAGQNQRAAYAVDSFCKLYPTSAAVLMQSAALARAINPELGRLQGACLPPPP